MRVRQASNPWRFGSLLAALTLTLAAGPFLSDEAEGVTGLSLLYTVVIVVGIYAVGHRRRFLIGGIVLAIPALAAEWVSNFVVSTPLVIGNMALSGVFILYIMGVVSYEVLDEDRVTFDTLFGGIAIYFLIAVGWVLAFSAIEYLNPGSFLIEGELLHAAHGFKQVRYPEFLYYSVVTMTTLGYGDVIPVTPHARATAAAEALVGQVYLAVFVARLVGLHLAGARLETRPPD